jgi:transposase
MDGAPLRPIHHAKVVKNEFENWENLGLSIFYLPTYSPHLNPIEILWRFCKYKCGAARAA